MMIYYSVNLLIEICLTLTMSDADGSGSGFFSAMQPGWRHLNRTSSYGLCIAAGAFDRISPA